MARREVAGRYKGSALGLAWSFFNPVFMLAVYTFVFSVVFKARWGAGGEESKTQFAVVLFVYLRDVGQTISIATAVMLFLAPVFYPVAALPEELRPWLVANPLTFIIEQASGNQWMRVEQSPYMLD